MSANQQSSDDEVRMAPNESSAVSSIFSGQMELTSEVRTNFTGKRAPPANPRLRPADQLCTVKGFGGSKEEALPESEAKGTYRAVDRHKKPLYGKTRAMDMWGTGWGLQ